MAVRRVLYSAIQRQLNSRKIILLTGGRQVGKTTLINQLADAYTKPKLVLDGEDAETVRLLSDQTLSVYQRWLGDTQLLIIDEIHLIPEFERVLNYLTTSFPDLTILATSSLSFVPLTNIAAGRLSYFLYPLAQLELGTTETHLQTRQQVEQRLVYGSYPQVIQCQNQADSTDYLKHFVTDYLLKDILLIERIRNPEKMLQLLRIIAYQVGQEIVYDDLSYQLQLDRNTIVRYLELFAKASIIFRLSGYNQNLRKEVTKSSKWYFFDNGVRNSLLNNVGSLMERPDIKVLWENYLVAERIKRNTYLRSEAKPYFWRTYDQQELDWLEDVNGQLNGYLFNWFPKKIRFPKGFQKAYPNATVSVINPENYLDFITPNYFNV
ncbi:ATP-binding protein [Spirosoma sp.]|uniref:ATP-binding protein n=1 Tax=Spirosoma sp. TaxID=1899569 RepID=UPI003B3A9D5D